MRYTIPRRNWLRSYLNIAWLRPENALWRSLNYHALEGLQLKNPAVDLSCGDGLFTFILCGGAFGISFDKFQGTAGLEKYHENKDIYNAAPDGYSPTIKTRPKFEFDVGTDWKPLQLEKADQLDFYDELIEHDNNEPLPFDDNRFQTLFTNSAYWVEEIDLHLEEISRVLQPDGLGIFVMKTPVVHGLMDILDSKKDLLGQELVDLIDRGRRGNKRHLHYDDGWTDRFESAGLTVQERRPTVSWWHASMWDIGLRPIAPYLIKMAQGLDEDTRREVKTDWIDLWEALLGPFDDPTFDFGRDQQPAEIIYVVSPS